MAHLQPQFYIDGLVPLISTMKKPNHQQFKFQGVHTQKECLQTTTKRQIDINNRLKLWSSSKIHQCQIYSVFNVQRSTQKSIPSLCQECCSESSHGNQKINRLQLKQYAKHQPIPIGKSSYTCRAQMGQRKSESNTAEQILTQDGPTSSHKSKSLSRKTVPNLQTKV